MSAIVPSVVKRVVSSKRHFKWFSWTLECGHKDGPRDREPRKNEKVRCFKCGERS